MKEKERRNEREQIERRKWEERSGKYTGKEKNEGVCC